MEPKAIRADAVSNITRILDAARQVFASGDGGGALSRVAQEAGVAAATLYRHFPNRQRLAQAVYARVFRAEIDPLLARLAGGDAPRAAMLQIAEEIAEVARRERGLVLSLDDLGTVTAELLEDRAEFFEGLVVRGQLAGNLRSDISGSDVPQLLGMLASASALMDHEPETRRRYLSLMLDAVRPQAPTG